MLGKSITFPTFTRQEGPRESVVKHPKLRSELINFEDETGLWWTENWQLWTVYLKVTCMQQQK